MKKVHLLAIIASLPDDADIDISVDVSTNEDTACDRVFVDEIFSWQHNQRNSYTILASGTRNF